MKLILLCCLFVLGFSGLQILNDDNVDQKKKGKTMMILFLGEEQIQLKKQEGNRLLKKKTRPSADHDDEEKLEMEMLEELEENFKKVAATFDDKDFALFAIVDCVKDAKEFCHHENIQETPEIKVGPSEDLEEFEGGHDYDSMKAFADAYIKPYCSHDSKKYCNKKELTAVEKYEKLTTQELNQLLHKEVKKEEVIRLKYEMEFKKLEKMFHEYTAKRDAEIDELKTDESEILFREFSLRDHSEVEDRLPETLTDEELLEIGMTSEEYQQFRKEQDKKVDLD